jgi:putative oxidoreductase
MAVAYLQFHWKVLEMPFTWNFDGAFDGYRWLPAVNKGELAALYCFLFLFFVFAGGRRCSIDRVLERRRVPVTTVATTTSPYR